MKPATLTFDCPRHAATNVVSHLQFYIADGDIMLQTIATKTVMSMISMSPANITNTEIIII